MGEHTGNFLDLKKVCLLNIDRNRNSLFSKSAALSMNYIFLMQSDF